MACAGSYSTGTIWSISCKHFSIFFFPMCAHTNTHAHTSDEGSVPRLGECDSCFSTPSNKELPSYPNTCPSLSLPWTRWVCKLHRADLRPLQALPITSTFLFPDTDKHTTHNPVRDPVLYLSQTYDSLPQGNQCHRPRKKDHQGWDGHHAYPWSVSKGQREDQDVTMYIYLPGISGCDRTQRPAMQLRGRHELLRFLCPVTAY